MGFFSGRGSLPQNRAKLLLAYHTLLETSGGRLSVIESTLIKPASLPYDRSDHPQRIKSNHFMGMTHASKSVARRVLGI